MDSIVDKELMTMIHMGKIEAFETIFHKYYNKLCHYAQGILGDNILAEEMVQDVFVRFWEKHSEIEINISIKPYLFRSVHNKCLNYIDHLKSVNKYQDYVKLKEENRIEFPATLDYPLVNLVVKEIESDFNKVLNSLPEQCRIVFELCRYEGLSYSDVANKLGISVNTVKTQMKRALMKLREGLKEYLP